MLKIIIIINRVERGPLKKAEWETDPSDSTSESRESEAKRKQEVLRKEQQQQEFLRNESLAKSVIDGLPAETRYSVSEMCEDEPCGEITYNVVIKKKQDKKVFFGIESSRSTKSSNYYGFCLRTQLMIRDESGKAKVNQELVDKLSQNPSGLPQTR